MLLARRPLLSLLAAGATLTMPALARQGMAQSPEGLEKLRPAEPRPLPELSFTDIEGTAKTLAEFSGRPLLINLWATWCAPCVAEMPALDHAQAALAPEGWLVLPLSSDRGGRSQVEPFYRQRGLRHLQVWLDPRGAAARALGVRGLPTTLVVDRQGQEVARLEGAAEWDAPAMLARLRALAGPAAQKT